jgi:uncharacterized damage-inducible protein DinB
MKFKNPLLENIFKSFKWARNNTLEILEEADKNGVLDYKPKLKSSFEFQSILFQFQCITTTTDVYLHQLKGNKNFQFGYLVKDGKVIKKKDIKKSDLSKILKTQLEELETIFKNFDEKQLVEDINIINIISNHEYLHQGQLIVMLREAGVDLPERFRKTFAL